MRGEKNVRVALAVAGAALSAAAARWLWCVRPHLVRTAGGPALVYTTRDDAGERVRVLRTGGVYQSATYLGERRMEPVFAYYRAFGRLFDLRPGARRVLAVGGGGFAFPKLVASAHPGVRADVVEIDPTVVEAARRWFFLDEAVALARGADLLVIDALHRNPHPTHLNFEKALEASRKIRAALTVFTHMTYRADYARESAALPPGVRLGYDGFVWEDGVVSED